jgi:hypothetical protein
VDVEHVHENRDAQGAPVHEGRFLHLGDLDDLAIGWRHDVLLAALTGALGVTKKVDDPNRQNEHDPRGDPERNRRVSPRQRHRAHRRGEADRDEEEAFACDAHDGAGRSSARPVSRA